MKTSRPGADISPLDGRIKGHVHTSMDADSSRENDDPTARPTNRNSQERIYHKRSMKKERVEMDAETQKQTKKILEEFLKKTLEKKANGSNYENLSKDEARQMHPGHGQFSKMSRVQVDERMKSTVQHMKYETDQRKLEDLMSGRYRGPSHQVSAVPMAGSDIPDSGRLQRSGSFTKAQRHSVVTELETQANNNEVLRRRNSEGLRAEPHHQEDLLTESESRADKQLTSPVVHNRANSDPVMVQCATAPRRHTPKKEAKEKKSWLPKLHFKKKREGHKLRSSGKDSVTVVETDVYGPPGTKIAKTPSDHRRKSPTPPPSPKRTPKLLRRFASILKKESPSASQHDIPRRHQSFERVETAQEAAYTESKSNSLPSKVGLSTHVNHTVDDPRHRVVLDGSRRHRKNKGNVQRPTTLDLQKKKSVKLSKRLKRFFIAAPSSSSSSSSSIASSSSAPDLTSTAYLKGTVTDGGSMEAPLGQPVPDRSGEDSKPRVSNVRVQYHHSASKSMSDMDSQEKSLSVIAAKLKSIADALQQTQYAGPAGQTRTPDSYYQDIRAKGDRSPGVNRSNSTSATKTASMSLTTFHNMDQARIRGGEMDPSQRITREDVNRQHQLEMRNWSYRVETERRNTAYQHLSHERLQKQASNSSQRSIPMSAHSPKRSGSRSSMPPLLQSTSPKLRGSRQSRVALDSGSAKRQISRHISQHTETTVRALSPTGSITSITSDQIDVYELVQADVVPFHGEREEDDVDFGLAAGFAEEDESGEVETSVTVRQEDVVSPSMEPATHTRHRAQTYPVRRLESELDGVEAEEERGAVGGEDPIQNDIDDKLVGELVRALCRRGDELDKELDLERTVMNVATTFTEETFKRSLQKAISIVYDNVSSWRHPEVVELVVIFKMYTAIRHLSMHQAVSGFFNSVINQIVSNFGGWGSLENSIDETSEEMRSYSKDGTTSPHQSTDKRGKDDHDELD